MGQYANNTTVSPEKTQSDIRKTLQRYGGGKFGIMQEDTAICVVFQYSNLTIRISVGLPDKSEFVTTETGRARKASAANDAYNQAVRQRWRALLLAIKAKLEAVESGISTIEREFMAFIVMPDERDLGDHLIPKLREISTSGKMPKLLSFDGNK
jgi:hypothetical protein